MRLKKLIPFLGLTTMGVVALTSCDMLNMINSGLNKSTSAASEPAQASTTTANPTSLIPSTTGGVSTTIDTSPTAPSTVTSIPSSSSSIPSTTVGSSALGTSSTATSVPSTSTTTAVPTTSSTATSTSTSTSTSASTSTSTSSSSQSQSSKDRTPYFDGKNYIFPGPENWEPRTVAYNASATDGGDVVNILVWNDEFIQRFKDHYPGAVEVKPFEEYTIPNPSGNGTLTVKFKCVFTQNNAYLNYLEEALANQSTASADEKLDMFLLESDSVAKYIESNSAVDISDLGITSSDISNMYQYTLDVGTSSDGRVKALTWQITPGVFAYRTDIADDVFGTHDPAVIQTKVSDWDEFRASAAGLKFENYKMISTYDETYRVFTNNLTQPIVNNTNGDLVIDAQLFEYAIEERIFEDEGFNHKAGMWYPEWSSQLQYGGDTFGAFLPTWGINFTLPSYAEVNVDGVFGHNLKGKYRICEGPESYFYGGSWLACANGSDNKTAVADILKKMTCDSTIAESIIRNDLDYTNNKVAVSNVANDPTFTGDTGGIYGGQNLAQVFDTVAKKVRANKSTIYDEEFIYYIFIIKIYSYIKGEKDLEVAYQEAYEEFVQKYPEFA